MQPEFSPDPVPSLPDHVPDDLLARYGREARRTVRHHLSRRYRVRRRLHGAASGTNAELWETTAVVFFLGIIGLCGLGGLAYAIYLWPTIGATLTAGLLLLFGASFLVARRMTRRGRENLDLPPDL
jgi:hypothetical protein